MTGSGGSLSDDWATRSTAAGVVLAKRLDNSTDITAYALQDGFQPRLPTLDTSIRSGSSAGSMRFLRANSDTTGSGLAKIPFGASYGAGQTFWVSYRIYAPAASIFQAWPTPDVTGRKFSIISNTLQSNMNHELVIQDTYQSGRVMGYYQDGVSTAVHTGVSVSTAGNASDFSWPPIDRAVTNHNGSFVNYPLTGTDPDSGAAWTTWQQERARYGLLYSAFSTPGAPDYKPGLGDPLTGAYRQHPNEWLTITHRVQVGSFGSFNSRWTVWAARDGQTYTELWDLQNIRLGGDGTANPYNCLWMPLYVSSGQSGGRQVTGRSNNIGGVTIHAAGTGTAIGPGVLEYTASSGQFRWRGSGESFGTARGHSIANGKKYLNVVSSNTNSWLVIEVTNAAALPSSGTVTDTVTIADQRPDATFNYADVIVSTLPINAPGGAAPGGVSAMADAAASMSVGWQSLTVSNQNTALGGGPSTQSILPYMGDVPWNPWRRAIEIVAKDATAAAPYRYARFDEASNSWQSISSDLGWGGNGHGLDHNVVNPYTGDFYHLQWDNPAIRKFSYSGSSWSSIPTIPNNLQVTSGVIWWSGSFVGAGSQGALIVISTFSAGWRLMAFDPLSNTWYRNTAPIVSTGVADSYNGAAVYSPKHNVAIFGGTNNASTSVWRLNSDGTVTALPNAPAPWGCSRGVMVNDPVTGNFLLLSGSGGTPALYELDPLGSGTWSAALTGARAAPSVANLGYPGRLGDSADLITACSIPDMGVVAFIRQNGSTGSAFYLYKHA